MLSVRFSYCYTECRYAECGYAKCRYAECRCARQKPTQYPSWAYYGVPL